MSALAALVQAPGAGSVGPSAAGADARPRYPLLLDLTDRDVLMVGGGPVAARRVAGLLAAGARVHVIAPQLCEDLADLVESDRVSWDRRGAAGDEPAGPTRGGGRWWLVHTATGDQAVDAAVAAQADRQGIWCVRADRAEESAAHTPAVAHGPDGVLVAVSGGGDPGRARAIRDAVSDLLAGGRLPLRRTRPTHTSRPTGITRTPRGDAIQVRSRSDASNLDRPAATRLELGADRGRRIPMGGAGDASSRGRVVLVGGGPGDPGLLTVAGRQWLARADVVVTDRLGPTSVLAELDPEVEIVDVGKAAGDHPIPQHQINDLLVEHAQLGRIVVRLKGGDPFVLGRGGEEALHCLAHGVPVEVVPGVTSAISVPAAAGIPVTHRGVTSSFVVASAHAGARNVLDAARCAPPDATLVLLMGLSGLESAARELVDAGRPASTPVAVISDGWSPRQRTVTGTLSTIAALVEQAALPGPAVIVVGEVVRLRTELRHAHRRVARESLPAGSSMAR